MKRLLLLVSIFFSSIPVFAQNAKPGPESHAAAAATQESAADKAPEKSVQGAKSRWRVSKAGAEQLRKDLKDCAAMIEDQQRECRREVYAARNDNLYDGDQSP